MTWTEPQEYLAPPHWRASKRLTIAGISKAVPSRSRNRKLFLKLIRREEGSWIGLYNAKSKIQATKPKGRLM